MTTKITTFMVGAGILALTGCGDATLGNTWHSEAGAFLDEGGFGNPTMQNQLAQMCRGQAKGYIVPDPVVALHPSSTAQKPVYARGRVLCSGRLNGKYAQVIFDEYVESATTPSQIEGGTINSLTSSSESGGG